MKSKILPLELNTRLEIECWTYYKFAIIQTLPEYMNWVSSHMSLYYNKDLERLSFGNYVKPHPVEYFADILDICELDLYEVPPKTIVEHIKQEIDQECYFVVFLRDRHMIWKNHREQLCAMTGFELTNPPQESYLLEIFAIYQARESGSSPPRTRRRRIKLSFPHNLQLPSPR